MEERKEKAGEVQWMLARSKQALDQFCRSFKTVASEPISHCPVLFASLTGMFCVRAKSKDVREYALDDELSSQNMEVHWDESKKSNCHVTLE